MERVKDLPNFNPPENLEFKRLKEYPTYLIYSNGYIFNIKSGRKVNITKKNSIYLRNENGEKHTTIKKVLNILFIEHEKYKDIILDDPDIKEYNFDHLLEIEINGEKIKGKYIINYPWYIIYENGKIYSIKMKKFLKAEPANDGYISYELTNKKDKGGKKVHRLIAKHFLNDYDNDKLVDHIDRNKLNNHVNNLRMASHSENGINKSIKKGGSSKYKGVCLSKEKWVADCAGIHIGTYSSEEEAAQAYDKEALAMFGKFALLNFLEDGRINPDLYEKEEKKEIEQPLLDNSIEYKILEEYPKYKIYRNGVVQKLDNKIIKLSINNNYICLSLININDRKSSVRLHRLLALAFIPNPDNKPIVDHIDNNTLNYKLKNLRWATSAENNRNQSIIGYNKTGFIGVYKSREKFIVCIMVDKKKIHVCGIKSAEEAAELYDKYALKYHKEFAKLNFKEKRQQYLEEIEKENGKEEMEYVEEITELDSENEEFDDIEQNY